jgi:chaperonin GroES
MNLEALHDKLIIRKIALEKKTAGGLILGSEIEKERETAFGRVLFAGEGKQIDGTGLIPTKTKVGDIIAFNEKMPRRVTYLGEQMYIIRESDVDFIVRDENINEKPYELEGYEFDKGIAKKLA